MELTVLGYPVHRGGYISKTNQTRCDMIAWKKAGAELPDNWLRLLIARYLELFYIKRLDGHPDGANLPIVAESWVEDIGYNLTEEIDSDRVMAGLRLLSRTIKKWPQPVELLACMPGRKINPPQSPFYKGGGSEPRFYNGAGSEPPFYNGAGSEPPFYNGAGSEPPFYNGEGLEPPFTKGGQGGFASDPDLASSALDKILESLG